LGITYGEETLVAAVHVGIPAQLSGVRLATGAHHAKYSTPGTIFQVTVAPASPGVTDTLVGAGAGEPLLLQPDRQINITIHVNLKIESFISWKWNYLE
jgi:hypothetical protein